ncbi:hypothetical protein C1280_02065 [Gemmata obscuriglobus]|uniref:Uncharacterized protein n=1 Tax=Gemmata obscuriglobus TaxID=114 RepID=A0A2Z3H2T1_9BACT|nr:hypothetical protein C1280_02065 [Gemmata obscuriglobus]
MVVVVVVVGGPAVVVGAAVVVTGSGTHAPAAWAQVPDGAPGGTWHEHPPAFSHGRTTLSQAVPLSEPQMQSPHPAGDAVVTAAHGSAAPWT